MEKGFPVRLSGEYDSAVFEVRDVKEGPLSREGHGQAFDRNRKGDENEHLY